MTVIEGVRAAAPDLRSGLADLRDAVPDLNLRELRMPAPAREALADLREAAPDARVVLPAVAAGLSELRTSLPSAPWQRTRPSIPRRIAFVVGTTLVAIAAAWLIAALIDRRHRLEVELRRGRAAGPSGSLRQGELPDKPTVSRFEASTTVSVPVRRAYDAWTQFEAFPTFMEGVERVEQLDDKHLRWTARVAGQRKDWLAEITDQTPDTRIAWKSTSGATNAGAVLFRSLGPATTEVTLRMEAEPEGPVETVGGALGILRAQVQGDLERFKAHVESGGPDGDGWRGEIHGDRVTPDPHERATRTPDAARPATEATADSGSRSTR